MSKNTELRWQDHYTKNFNIYFIPRSLAEKHLNEISRKEEELMVKLENYLGVKNSNKINLYLYPSLTLKKKELGGTSGGQARFKGRNIAYVYNHKYPHIGVYHEETHILCFEWGKPISFIEGQDLISTASFYEGLAMHTQSKFFNKYFYKYSLNAKSLKGLTLNQAIKPDVEAEKAPLIKEILMYEGYCNKLKNGAQLGSVVDYLIETYGIPKFKKLFISLSENKSQNDNEKVFLTEYGKTIDEIDGDWRSYILSK